MMVRLKALYILSLLILGSCNAPAPSSYTLEDDNKSEPTNNIATDVGAPTTYFQMSGQTTSSSLSINKDYNDSFLIRGNPVHNYILNYTDSVSNRCIIAHFPTSTQNKVVALSLKVRSTYNYAVQSTEYYFQIEPNDYTANFLECSGIDVSNTINSLYATSLISYDIAAICPTCSLDLLSNEVKLIQDNGLNITQIFSQNMRLNILPGSSSGNNNGNQNQCSDDNACSIDGFDCCLEGQCVNHGAVKPGVNFTSPDYQTAANQVSQDPSQLFNYPNYFYVCPNINTGGNDDGDDNSDPNQEIDEEFVKLQELFNCLNPIDDEFSYCTFTQENTEALLEGLPSKTFVLSNSDINFNSLNGNLPVNNIVEVTLGGNKIFEDQVMPLDPAIGSLGTANDTLGASQDFTLNSPLPAGTTNDTLKIKYKIDGTCKKLSSTLAQCTKSYKQGQITSPIARASDHPTSQAFSIPSYAATDYNVIVKVGGATVAESTSTWTLVGNTIIFNGSSYPIYNNQEVDITYFITGSNVANLNEAKSIAQTEVNTICSCQGGINCNLEPVYESPGDSTTPVVSYSCTTPDNNTSEGPLQKTLYISSKSAAHKFFDSNGVYYKYENIGNNKQECAVNTGDESNCTSFEYESNNKNKPNNQFQYIGFNEIYGTFTTEANSGVPSTEVEVIKGRTYDLFTDEGVFSSCSDCGTDYYSTLARLFPNSFIHKGGGYLPNMVESRRSDNQSEFNADDHKFGRACFVPATMIPWTHQPNADVTTQRRNRLKAQHFLFANGYNKDWYGFDYGSLIGSFDGVTWFSIGNQRNIVAKSNKLFLAINAYYSDETLNNSFRITINEVVPIANSGSSVVHDLQSDGAQCQLAHMCSSDNDCITQLGYDYACESVSQIKTPWPKFDDNGNEISGFNNVSIASLVGGTNGEPKRCIYRGRGALCSYDPSVVDANDSYAQTSNETINRCSNNNFCSSLSSANFNTKISRYAKSPTSQNQQDHISDKSDLFGMGARFLGRPYSYFGSELPPSGVAAQLTANNVSGVCTPGVATNSATTIDQLNNFDPFTNTADENFEIGQTKNGLGFSESYLAACPATDSNGNFTYKAESTDVSLDDNDIHNKYAIAQNMSSNLFNLNSLSSSEIFNGDTAIRSQGGYNRNSCIRSPGSTCFTDLDCSVNSWISNKFKSVSNFNGEINEAEQDFWKEDLVCATSQKRYPAGSIYPNPAYAATEKKCCRETDKSFTFYTQRETGSTFSVKTGSGDIKVAGINTDINDPERYSRIHTIYDLLQDPTNEYPALITPNENSLSTQVYPLTFDKTNITNQFKTLHAHNERMCCTGHWVREFNSGGHKFDGNMGQDIPEGSLRALNWLPNIDGGTAFECTLANADTPNCEMRNIVEGSSYEKKWLEWFGKFELTGIPQILIESYNDEYFKPVDDNQDDPAGVKDPINGIFSGTPIEDTNIAGEALFSAASAGTSSSKFDVLTVKKVFSDKDFACCLPTGIQVDDDVTNSACCTGQVTEQNGPRRCCLNDFTDLSVYTNRYVSSEGAKFNGLDITDSDIDNETGYIRKELVKQMGASMCCSGRAEYGVAISELFIPLTGDTINPQLKKRRFIDNSGMDNDPQVNGAFSRFNAGVKWNNHVYCVPSDF